MECHVHIFCASIKEIIDFGTAIRPFPIFGEFGSISAQNAVYGIRISMRASNAILRGALPATLNALIDANVICFFELFLVILVTYLTL